MALQIGVRYVRSLAACVYVLGRVLVQQWRPICQRLIGLEDGRQLLVLYEDGLQRLISSLGCLGRHDRHPVSDEPDAIPGEDWPVEQTPAETHPADVVYGQHSMDAWDRLRGGDVDRQDSSVRYRTAQELGPEHTWELHVRSVVGRPRYLLLAFHSILRS